MCVEFAKCHLVAWASKLKENVCVIQWHACLWFLHILLVCTNQATVVNVQMHPFSKACHRCLMGAHPSNTLQVAVWDSQVGWWQCAAPLLPHLSAMAEDRMQFPARGRPGGSSGWGVGGCKEHQRPLKAIRNLSTASTACQLASPRSPCGAPSRQLWPHTLFTVFVNTWVCVCVRIKIPLHLEAQTPWAGALRAAIRHVAVWREGHSLSFLPPYLSSTDTHLLSSLSIPSPLTVGSACWLSVLLLLSVEMRGQDRAGSFSWDALVVCTCECSVMEPLN